MFQTARTFICAIVIAALVSPATAEETAETARAPKAAMDRIDAIAGDWISTVEILTDAGEWATQAVSHVRITAHFDGLLLTEEELQRLEGDETSPELKVDYTYDQYREVYRLSAIDSGWGIMDVYEGALEDGDLIVTNLRADTSFPLDGGGALHFQLRIPVSGDHRLMQINISKDAGASWRPFYRVSYERRAD